MQVHCEALHRRGLSDEVIDRNRYRTLSVQGRARQVGAMREQFGDELLRVPGFVVKPGEDGRPYITIAGSAGLYLRPAQRAGTS